MTNINTWVAHRSFTVGEECRVVISNEKHRELLVLEGAAAQLWSANAADSTKPLELICAEQQFPLDEAMQFVEELTAIGLLQSNTDPTPTHVPVPNVIAIDDIEVKDAPRQGLLPGTDDLEAEFEFQDWAKDRGYLWAASWELTYRCNEKCLHCYNPGASHDHAVAGRRGTRELKKDEWTKLLYDLKELGVFRLALTGGEVLLKRDFFEICALARELGFSVTISTNGLLVTDAVVQKLAALWPHRVELSVYSHDATKHDQVTGVDGSLQSTLQAAQKLRLAGLTVMLKMVVMKDTIDDIDDFKELGDIYQCETMVDGTLSVGNDGSHETYMGIRPGAFDLIRSVLNPSNPLWCGTKDEPRNRYSHSSEDSVPCGAGHSLLSISPEGNIYPCLAFPLYVGSTSEVERKLKTAFC